MSTVGWPRFDLYVITDATLIDGRSHLEIARAALEGGADAPIPETEEALNHAAAVVLGRPVVAAVIPLLCNALRGLVDIVDLVDGHPLVGVV